MPVCNHIGMLNLILIKYLIPNLFSSHIYDFFFICTYFNLLIKILSRGTQIFVLYTITRTYFIIFLRVDRNLKKLCMPFC